MFHMHLLDFLSIRNGVQKRQIDYCEEVTEEKRSAFARQSPQTFPL